MSSIKFAEGNAYFFAHIHAWWCQDLLGINSDWCSAMSFFFLSLREQFSYRLQDALGGVVNKPFWPKYKFAIVLAREVVLFCCAAEACVDDQ